MYGPMSFKILGEYMGVYNTRFRVRGEGWYLISGLSDEKYDWKFIESESGKNSHMTFFSFIDIQGLF